MSDELGSKILAVFFFLVCIGAGIVCEIFFPMLTDGVAEHGWWLFTAAVIGFWGAIAISD